MSFKRIRNGAASVNAVFMPIFEVVCVCMCLRTEKRVIVLFELSLVCLFLFFTWFTHTTVHTN